MRQWTDETRPDTAVRGPLELFGLTHDAFQRAVARSGARDYRLSVAGTDIHVTFAGPALEKAVFSGLACDPVGHGERPPGPAPHVCMWDSRSTGVPLPPPPRLADGTGARGELYEWSNDSVSTCFSVEGPILTVFDRRSGTAVYWVRDVSDIPYYERAAPMRSLLSWVLAPQRRQVVHAAAVGRSDGCVLLAGKGGAGKSNLALGCLAIGLSYLADDYCVIAAEPRARAYSLYTTGKVHARDLDRLSFLAPAVSNRERLDLEKAVFFLARHYPSQLLREAPLAAVLLPRLTDNLESTLRPASPAKALLALAPSTTSQLPHAGGEVMRTISAVVRQVPCYHLEIGRDGRAAGLVAGCLETVQRA